MTGVTTSQAATLILTFVTRTTVFLLIVWSLKISISKHLIGPIVQNKDFLHALLGWWVVGVIGRIHLSLHVSQAIHIRTRLPVTTRFVTQISYKTVASQRWRWCQGCDGGPGSVFTTYTGETFHIQTPQLRIQHTRHGNQQDSIDLERNKNARHSIEAQFFMNLY